MKIDVVSAGYSNSQHNSMYHRLAIKKLTTTSCVKNKSEIYCTVPLVLLKMERFKYYASMVDLAMPFFHTLDCPPVDHNTWGVAQTFLFPVIVNYTGFDKEYSYASPGANTKHLVVRFLLTHNLNFYARP